MEQVSRIDINTVLSENFLSASNFTGYRNVCPITATGESSDYLVGTDSDGKFLIACPKNMGESGHILLSTGYTTSVFDTESGINGDIITALVDQKSIQVLSIRQQKVERSCRIDLGLSGGDGIVKLIAYRRDYVLYLFAFCKTEGKSGYHAKTAELFLPDWKYSVTDTGFTSDRVECACLRDNLSILLFTFDQTHYITYDSLSGEQKRVKMDFPGTMLCFSPVNSPIDGEGIVALFQAEGRSKVYALDLETLTWMDVNLKLEAVPRKLDVAYYENFFHLFVSAENGGVQRLYHASRSMDDTRWKNELIMLPVSGDIRSFSVNKAEESRLSVCYEQNVSAVSSHPYGMLTSDTAAVEYLSMEKDGRWNLKQTVVDASDDSVFSYQCYTTQAAFFDENGLAWPNLEVELSSECNTELIVNNRTLILAAGEWTTIMTNALGCLSIVQKAGELGVPDLNIRPADKKRETYKLIQYDKFSKKFENITESDLKNAKLDDGSALVPQKYSGCCGEIAQLVREAFSNDNFNYHLFQKNEVIAHNPSGIYCAPQDDTAVFGEVVPERQVAFKIDFLPSGSFRFRNFAGQDEIPMLIDSNGFWGKLCDFSRSVSKKAVSLVSMAVQTAGKYIAAAAEFVLDGVQCVVKFLIRTVKDMISAVSAVFQRFQMDFNRLFRWLGQLFSWRDIMNTKRDLELMINRQLSKFSDTFIEAADQMQKVFTFAINEGGKTAEKAKECFPNGYDMEARRKSVPPDSPFYEGQSNNVVYSRIVDMMDNPQAASCVICLSDDFLAETDSLIDEMLECAKDFGAAVLEEVKQKCSFFTKLGGVTEITKLIGGLDELLTFFARLGQNAVATLAQGVGKLIARLMEQLIKILNMELHIPLLTPLLEKVFGISGVTMLDVITTMIAIPFTIVSKLIYGKSPSIKSGMLGNAYGWLKGGYILTGVCVLLYYALCIGGVFATSKLQGSWGIFLFNLLPGILLLVWTIANAPESDTHQNSGTTDALAMTMSCCSVGLYLISAIVYYLSTKNEDDPIAPMVNGVTIIFGLISIIIGVCDMIEIQKTKEWSDLDILIQRNGILTGLADICIAAASFLMPSGVSSRDEGDERDDTRESNSEKAAIIVAAIGGLAGAVEGICVFVETGVKPFIDNIKPDGGEIANSGTVEITFDTDMDTRSEKAGTVRMDDEKLPQGTWNGRTYTTRYSELTKMKEYFLIVEDFVDSKGVSMEKDRYTVRVKA